VCTCAVRVVCDVSLRTQVDASYWRVDSALLDALLPYATVFVCVRGDASG
jgi:hypothetical protein